MKSPNFLFPRQTKPQAPDGQWRNTGRALWAGGTAYFLSAVNHTARLWARGTACGREQIVLWPAWVMLPYNKPCAYMQYYEVIHRRFHYIALQQISFLEIKWGGCGVCSVYRHHLCISAACHRMVCLRWYEGAAAHALLSSLILVAATRVLSAALSYHLLCLFILTTSNNVCPSRT